MAGGQFGGLGPENSGTYSGGWLIDGAINTTQWQRMILLCALHLMDSLCVRLCVFKCVCLSVYVSERKAERLGFFKKCETKQNA